MTEDGARVTARATGRHERHGDQDCLTFRRHFRAPIEDVWAAVTESDRSARWIGTWSGDPASGSVLFRMNAEGDDFPESTYEIRACDPPRLFTVHAVDEFGTWRLTLELTEQAGTTTLTLRQILEDPKAIENTGPGWDYYLDRLVAAETGADPNELDFDRDYYPALQQHYLDILAKILARD